MNIVEFLKERRQVLKLSAVALMGAAAIYMVPTHMSRAMMATSNDTALQPRAEVIDTVVHNDRGSVDVTSSDKRTNVDTDSQSEQMEHQYEFVSVNDGKQSLNCSEGSDGWNFSLVNDKFVDMQSCVFDAKKVFNCKNFLNEAADKLIKSGDTFSLKDLVCANPSLSLKEIYVRGKGRLKCNKNYDDSWLFSLQDDKFVDMQSCVFDAKKVFNCKNFLNEAADKLIESGDTFSLKDLVCANPNLSLKEMYVKGKGKLSLDKNSYDENWSLCLKNDDYEEKETYIFDVSDEFNSRSFLNEAADKLIKSGETFSLKDLVCANPNLSLKEIYVRGKARIGYDKNYDDSCSLVLKNDDYLVEETYTFNVSEEFDAKSFLSKAVNNVKVRSSDFITLKDFMSSYPGLSIKEYARGEKIFIEGGITYNIEDYNKVSIISVDKALEILDFEKPVIHNGNIYEVIRIKRKDNHCMPILYGSKVKMINFPAKGIDIDCLLFWGARELKTIKNLNKTNIQSMESNEWYIDYTSLFFDCINLSEVDLPDTLAKIGRRMFFNCRSLHTVTIRKNVSEIEEDVFWDAAI